MSYEPDQAAVEWAAHALERQLARLESVAAHAEQKLHEPERATGLRQAARILRQGLIGGEGCVITAFDARRPKIMQALGEEWDGS